MGTNNRKKSLDQIKGLDKAHPYSRKATQMKRVIQRSESLHTDSKKRQASQQIVLTKLLWYQDRTRELAVITLPQFHSIVMEYIDRFGTEIDELVRLLRPNRPKSSRQLLLQNLMQKEKSDYSSGMEVPNLMDLEVLKALREWEGGYNSISLIKIIQLKALK